MDYRFEFLEYIENGVIVYDLFTLEVAFINKIAKKILNNNLDDNINSISDISSIDSIDNILDNIKAVFLKPSNISDNIIITENIYLKSSSNSSMQVTFECTWFDKSKNLISLVFKDVCEIINKESIIQDYCGKNIKFEEITEFLPSGVLVMNIDEEMSVEYANSEQCRIMGIDESKKNLKTFLKDSIYEEDKDWVISEIYQSFHHQKDVDIEFRMKSSDNTAKWVRLFGRAKQSDDGSILFYSSIKDLSNRREINDKLHLERVLFHKLTEMSEEILFRLDLSTKIIHFLGNRFPKIFNIDDTVAENFPESILERDIIYEEDLPIFNSMLQSFKNGECKLVELRLKMKEGLTWYNIQYNFVKSSENSPLLVVGKLINIQKQKLLEQQAKIDLLTGFYNKINSASEVNKLILEKYKNSSNNKNNSFTFFIIDIDYFKSINDNLGHHFGDIVLHDIASDISNCFRHQDILGRIGGDEFIAVMQDCENLDDIETKARQVCNALQKTFKGKDKSYSISASIGISRYPIDGVSYEMLYQKADIALYQTKENGKNNFTIYSTNLNTKTKQIISQIHTSKRTDALLVNFTVIATVFNLLYETLDIRLSLNTILEYIGLNYKLDRCYIFETLDDGNTFTNDYQWDRGLGFITEERVQYIDESVLLSIFELADEDGAYFTNDIYEISNKDAIEILEKDNVKSMYIVQSLKNKNKRAFFGVEYCREEKILLAQEQRTLFHVARMIFGTLTEFNIIQSLNKKINILENEN